MKNTFKKVILCASIAAFAGNSLALDHQSAFEADKDAFMEFVFFKKIKSEKQKGWKPVEGYTNFTISGASLLAGLYLLQNQTTKDTPTNMNLDGILTTATKLGLLVIPVAYAVDTYWLKPLTKDIKDNANQTVLFDFLADWNTNKQYTPEKYHAFFDKLATLAQTENGKAYIAKNAGDIVEIIQFIIQRTELKVSEVFAEGAFGEEGKDIYEAKPSFKILKDFSPLKDVNSVVDSLFGNKK
ncbi:hypothetical protein EBR77_01555 [bacterium]|nr:hypothetical protein [bacterium]